MERNLISWLIAGRCFIDPPPPDWQVRLTTRLGQRPRRLGRWVELALFGALHCMDDAGEAILPSDALLSVATLHGPDLALRAALAEARDTPPLPIAFLNSQPGQVLPALAQHLSWQGDGRCVASRDPIATLILACTSAGPGGLLLGWVDEDGPGHSLWLRLVADSAPEKTLRRLDFSELADPRITHLGLDGTRLTGGARPPVDPDDQCGVDK